MPYSQPLVVLDRTLKIYHANNTFKDIFNVIEGDTLNEIPSEPGLLDVFETFAGSNFFNFKFDLCLYPFSENKKDFIVDFERIFINNNEMFVVILRNLEERIQLEEKIVDLHTAMEYGKIPVLIADENGTAKYSTRSFEEIFNVTIEDIYNKKIISVVSRFLSPEESGAMEKAVLNDQSWSGIIQLNFTKKTKYYELILNPIVRETESRFFVLSVNDITDLILKKQILEHSEKQLKLIIENISDLLLILRRKDDVFCFENCNENFSWIFDVDKQSSINKQVDTLFKSNFIEDIEDAIASYLADKEHHHGYNFNNLSERKYFGKITSIEDTATSEDLFIINLKDVTEQLEYQEQLQNAYKKQAHLNKLKTAFLENMSHEIRTPFNAILGYSEIIEDCTINGDYDTIKDLTLLVKDVLDRVLNLFTNIVEVSLIESGEIQLENNLINCAEVLKSVYNKKSNEAFNKDLQYLLELDEEPMIITGDWVKLEKILLSIVDNSIKYTREGRVQIIAGASEKEVIILVRDTGKGIEESEIQRLLEPFSQEDEGSTRQYEGAGLGLAIAYNLTKLMHGRFIIDTKKGIGTTITLAFPLILSD